MFTGITRGTYPITSVDRNRDLLTYVVELDADLSAGPSGQRRGNGWTGRGVNAS